MKKKERDSIKAENKRFGIIAGLLLWLLFLALLIILNIVADSDVMLFLPWFGFLSLFYFTGILLMLSYIYTGSANFFKYLVKTKPKPIVQPRVSFNMTKLLDEYKLDFNTTKGWDSFETDKIGRDRLLDALNKKNVRFVSIPEIMHYDKDSHDQIINIDNITTINSVQRCDTQYGSYGATPKKAEEEIKKLLADGYVLAELKADNTEAESAVEKLKKEFKFKGDDD